MDNILILAIINFAKGISSGVPYRNQASCAATLGLSVKRTLNAISNKRLAENYLVTQILGKLKNTSCQPPYQLRSCLRLLVVLLMGKTCGITQQLLDG